MSRSESDETETFSFLHVPCFSIPSEQTESQEKEMIEVGKTVVPVLEMVY